MTAENTSDDAKFIEIDHTDTSDKQFIEDIVETKEVPSKWELKLRKENETQRKKYEAQLEAERQKVAAKEAEFKASAEQIEAKYREKAAFAELKAEAVKANIVDTDVLKLMDRSAAKYSDDGELLNAGELIEALRTSKPHFFTSATSVAAAVPTPKAPVQSGPLDWGKMTDSEYRAHLAAIKPR